MIPCLVFYTDRVPQGFGGVTNAFVIRIRPKFKGNAGLLAHEKEHVRQFWMTLGLHGLLYFLFKKYRLWAEVRAYRIQLSYEMNPVEKEQKRQLFKEWVATKYKLNIRPEDVPL